MHEVWCILLSLISLCWTLRFPHQRRPCEDLNGSPQSCVPIDTCHLYQTSENVRQYQPRPCGFQGQTPLVCCPGKNPLFGCGDQNGPSLTATSGIIPRRTAGPSASLTRPRRHRSTQSIGTDSAVGPAPFGEPDVIQSGSCPPPGPDGSLTSGECQQAIGLPGIGGYNAELGSWPWIAAFGHWKFIEERKYRLEDWFCGGTLISPFYILTAAHCISPNDTDAIGVRIGDNDLSTDTEVTHLERMILWARRHQEYHGSQNDIALVKVREPALFGDVDRFICLPLAGTEYATGTKVAMAGWGHLQYKGTEVPNVLQEVVLKIEDVRKCESSYSQVTSFDTKFPGGFQNTKLCAVSPDDQPRDACDGDSGGPLMVEISPGFYELVGIISTGVGCGHPDFPGIYTKVSAYIPWIEENAV